MRKLALVVLAAAVTAPAASAAGPLHTAVFAFDDNPLTYRRIHDAGATFVRVTLDWRGVAPPGKKVPAGFDPSNPSDRHYRWGPVDTKVKLAVAHGLQPYLTVSGTPAWAQGTDPHPSKIGPFVITAWKPNVQQFAAFAHAAAVRYGGGFRGLPRVRYWEVWNEPNLTQYLSPQIDHGTVVSAGLYRALVNAFAGSVHAVHPDDVVAAGAQSAFAFDSPYGRLGIAPLEFMRDLLCMSAGKHPKPTCNAKVSFDAWSHHPWTSGGPTHHASAKGDVSLGDLPEMKRLLDAAVKAGHVRSRRKPQLWVTEFGWDTRPPDPNPLTAPLDLQSRWVSEALYRASKLGIDVFTWLALWDQPYPHSAFQSGLLFRNGESLADAQPKPTFDAFRFPFVAYRHKRKIAVWGRTPWGRRDRVVVQRRRGARWRTLRVLRANRSGMFSARVPYSRVKAAPPSKRPAAGVERYRDLVLSGSPIAYWPLSDQSGKTAADATGHNRGTYLGGFVLGRPGPLRGSSSVTLDGATGRVGVGPVTNVHSVELWLKTAKLQSSPVFSNRNKLGQFTFLGVDGGLAFSFDGYPIRTDDVGDGQWHQVVYAYDSTTSTGEVYVDGRLRSSAVYPHSEGGASASIGWDAALGKSHFGGSVAQVSVYGYRLTAAQVRAHYLASGRTLTPKVMPGVLRAVDLRTHVASLPFSLHRPKDRYVLPFGGGGY